MKKSRIIIRSQEQERPIWLKDFIAGYQPTVVWTGDRERAKEFRTEREAKAYLEQIPLHRQVELERIPLEVLKK